MKNARVLGLVVGLLVGSGIGAAIGFLTLDVPLWFVLGAGGGLLVGYAVGLLYKRSADETPPEDISSDQEWQRTSES